MAASVDISFMLGIYISVFFTIAGIIFILKNGAKLSLFDIPKARSSHSSPTCRGGGIGICIASFIISLFILRDVFLASVMLGVGILGFVDDLFSLPPLRKFCFQALLSSVLVFYLLWPVDSWVGILLVAFWIIFLTGTANFFNFMDGINGMAGLAGVVSFALLGYAANFYYNEERLAILGFSIAAGCLVFLPFNMPKARIFMGDAGSTFLGVLFAFFVMKLSTGIIDLICLSSFLFTFYADELITMAIRVKNREDLTKAHRRHIYQLLANEKSVPHWLISVIYGIIQFSVGSIAFLLKPLGPGPVLFFLCIAFFGAVLASLALRSAPQEVSKIRRVS